MFEVGGARIELRQSGLNASHYNVWVLWTRDGFANEHSILISGELSGLSAGYAAAHMHDMLRHVYGRGRADASQETLS